jgi:DNA-binding beta-propeller fold protein YncE
MKTQLSRASFNPSKRYSSVYQQQGRALTDADWNELSDIVKARLNEALQDVIGSGTPQDRGIVKVTVTGDGKQKYALQWGYVYVDGIIAQVRPAPNAALNDPQAQQLEYDKQADFPNPPTLPNSYQLYLDVWERTVLSLEDEHLRDPGLHGADTCTRTQTMAQVKWAPLNTNADPDPENPEHNPPKGNALLTLKLRAETTEPDPCDPCADEISLLDKVGNYLFRVEVHDVEYDENGNPTKVTLKWSSENGAEQYAIDNQPPGFAAKGWVYDFFHGETEQFASDKHLGFHLSQDPNWTPARSQLSDGYPNTPPSGYSFVRRWDGYCVLELDSTDWKLASDSDGVLGSDRGVALSTTTGNTTPGHVVEGSTVVIHLDAMNLSIDLDHKKLLAGDFWYVPVRAAVHTVGDTLLEQAEPHGIIHHYMTLATVTNGIITGYNGEQCKRLEFPPLTDLRADDICFDNDNCQLPSANTVQQALDHLCQEQDLSWHHQHLHGWGIVCGLVVICEPEITNEDKIEAERSKITSRRITVGTGAALDCQGNIIELKQPYTFDFINFIEKAQAKQEVRLLDSQGNGSLCMSMALGKEGHPIYHLEPYEPANFRWQSLLEGTLLMDFFDECVLDLINSLREEIELNPNSDVMVEKIKTSELVGLQQRRMIALQNLIIHLDKGNAHYIFLSKQEHNLLEDLYLRLREKLQSKTFCAQFKGDKFPRYPFPDTHMTTLFGKGSHTDFIVHSCSNRAYSFAGTDNTINVYDLEAEELIDIIKMPAGEGAKVRSVAVSLEGNRLYAVAIVGEVNTVFGFADISDNAYQWYNVTLFGEVVITKLIVSEKYPELLYAIGKGTGLYVLHPQLLLAKTNLKLLPIYVFNAVGHLVVDENNQRAFATASNGETPDNFYNQIVYLSLAISIDDPILVSDIGSLQPDIVLPLNTHDDTGNFINLIGNDDIALGGKIGSDNLASMERLEWLYVVANHSSNSRLKYLITYDIDRLIKGGWETEPLNVLKFDGTTIRLAFHQPTGQLLMSIEDGYRIQRVDSYGKTVMNFRIPVQISPIAIASDSKNNQVYVLNSLSNTISRVPGFELDVDDQFLEKLVHYRQDILHAFYALFGSVLQYLKDCFCHHLLVNCPTCEVEDKLYLACIEVKNHRVYHVCNFSKRKYVKSFPTVEYWLSLIPVIPILEWSVKQVCCMVLPDLFGRYTEKFVPPIKAGVTDSMVDCNNTPKSQLIRSGLQTYQQIDLRAIYHNLIRNLTIYSKRGLDFLLDRSKISPVKGTERSKSALVGNSVSEAQTHLKHSGITVATKTTIATEDLKAEIAALQQEKTALQADLQTLKIELTAIQKQREAIGDIAALREQLTELATLHKDIKLAIAKESSVQEATEATPEADSQTKTKNHLKI